MSSSIAIRQGKDSFSTKRNGNPFRTKRHKDPFVYDDGGFTTLAVAVAILLVLALLLSAAQVHWIERESPDVQFAADAAALAAENVVSQYYVISKATDSILLSMSLLSISMFGIAIVLCCIPATTSVGLQVMQAARNVTTIRDRFADSAIAVLDTVQSALPFLSAANAAAVVSRNSEAMGDHSMMGLAVLVPMQGDTVDFGDDSIAEYEDTMEESNTDTAEQVEASEEILEAMDELKERAYMRDCGDNPSYCMYERASTLAGLSGASNPYYSSSETWWFSVALDRAQAYYAARLASEAPEGSSLDELINSACRERFYSYAVELLNQGYVVQTSDGSYDMYFPLLPSNTNEMRQTSLYTELVWPISTDGIIHGVSDCPAYQQAGASGKGSLSELEAGTWTECSECDFSAVDMGRVGSASSSINNGFEYHYRVVAECASEYASLSDDYVEAIASAQSSASESLDAFTEAMEELNSGGSRYNPSPPGRNGCVSIVVDLDEHEVPNSLLSSLLSSSGSYGARLAVSGAALAAEAPIDGNNVISTMLDAVYTDAFDSGSGAFLEGSFSWLLELWGGALQFYSDGVEGLSSSIENILSAIPGISDTPLGSWASGAIMSILETLGLEPVDLSTPRPVTVNTVHVLSMANEDLSTAIEEARQVIELGSVVGTLSIEGFFDSSIDILLPDLDSIDSSIFDAIPELIGGG